MKVVLFFLFTLLLCLAAKKKHLVRQDQECPQGKYFFALMKTCILCPTGCSACLSSRICSACKENWLFENNSCSCLRPSFFLNWYEEKCQACPVDCLECRSENQCTKCKEGLGFKKDQGCIPCEVGSFLHQDPDRCRSCGFGCLQCTSRDECTQCAEANNYELQEGMCECKPGYFRSYENSSDDFSFRTLACQACPVDCLGCSSKDTCYQCKEGLGFDKDEGCVPCKEGFYLDKNFNKCQSCDLGCSQCVEIGNCTQCFENYHSIEPTPGLLLCAKNEDE